MIIHSHPHHSQFLLLDPSIYSTQQPPSTNLNIGQPSIYAPMIASNPGTTSLRPANATTFYTQPQQPPVDYDYKQQAGGAHIYNYMSMIPPGTSNFIHQQPQQQQQPALHPQQQPPPPQPTSATGSNQIPSQHVPLPILVQQPGGQLQYIFPAHALPPQQQQQQQPPPPTNAYPLTPDGQYVPVNILNQCFLHDEKQQKKLLRFLFFSLYRFIDRIIYPYRAHNQ